MASNDAQGPAGPSTIDLDVGEPLESDAGVGGHTRKIRPGEQLGPALPFRTLSGPGLGAAAESPQVPVLHSIDEPEAYTEAVRLSDLNKPALPFQADDGAPPSGRLAAASPQIPGVAAGGAIPFSPAPAPDYSAAPSSQWEPATGFDPSELPSAHLAEIAAPASVVAKPHVARRTIGPGAVLVVLALAVGGLLVAASVLRW